MTPPRRPAPWWFWVVVVLAAVPMFAALGLTDMTGADDTLRFLARLYPVYIVLSGICAGVTYRDRPLLAWILVVLMLLSDAGIISLLILEQ